MKEILKILTTLAVGMLGLWAFGFVRIDPFPTLICRGKSVLTFGDYKPSTSDVERVVQIGITSVTVDNMSIDIKHKNDVKIEFSNYWEDPKIETWFHHYGWLDRTNGNASIIWRHGKKGEEKPNTDTRDDLKCSKAPDRIF